MSFMKLVELWTKIILHHTSNVFRFRFIQTWLLSELSSKDIFYFMRVQMAPPLSTVFICCIGTIIFSLWVSGYFISKKNVFPAS